MSTSSGLAISLPCKRITRGHMETRGAVMREAIGWETTLAMCPISGVIPGSASGKRGMSSTREALMWAVPFQLHDDDQANLHPALSGDGCRVCTMS